VPRALPFVPGVPAYRVATSLEGVTYLLDVHWNERDGAWYFDIYQADETPIRYGIKVVLGALLGGRVVDEAMPPGYVIAADLSGEGRDAGYDDLGDRVLVYYYTREELGLAP
jgi:hypothetical protein